MRLLLRPIRCSLLPNRYNTSLRKFTTSTPTLYPSPTTLLVSRLRKETGCSISKAREALTHLSTTTDPEQLYTAALEWLEQESAASASKKAAKLGSRTAKEGLIATTILQNRGAAIIELNSETDFVSRSEDFITLSQRISATAAVLAEDLSPPASSPSSKNPLPLTQIQPSVLLPPPPGPLPDSAPSTTTDSQTIQESLTSTIGKLGENIQLRRITVSTASETSGTIVGSYVHGDSKLPKGLGRIGALAALRIRPISLMNSDASTKVETLAKKLAQHIVGFGPKVIRESDVPSASIEPKEDSESEQEFLDRVVLLRQQFVFGGGSVDEVVKKVGEEVGGVVEVVQFERYECGEGIVKEEVDFAEEVKKQAGLA